MLPKRGMGTLAHTGRYRYTTGGVVEESFTAWTEGMRQMYQEYPAYLLAALSWALFCCAAAPFDWRASNDLARISASSRSDGSCASSGALSILASAIRSTRWLLVCAAGGGADTATCDARELRFRAGPLRFLGAETVAILKQLKEEFLVPESPKKGLFPTRGRRSRCVKSSATKTCRHSDTTTNRHTLNKRYAVVVTG